MRKRKSDTDDMHLPEDHLIDRSIPLPTMTREQKADRSKETNTKVTRGNEFVIEAACRESTASGSQCQQQNKPKGVCRAKTDREACESNDHKGSSDLCMENSGMIKGNSES